ncbi:lactose-binding lectin l-2-like [Conger conger]|uniref:lactose-binding lectin l-2-like n=1 Tax=Conger conger TaxID=82655 RepID=UPI002A59F0F6|nr:lactose-binding lectin l-2-like [Conger conger]
MEVPYSGPGGTQSQRWSKGQDRGTKSRLRDNVKKLHCVSLGGNLASEHSQDDHQFLKKLNENDKPFWIGLADVHKEGTWLWSDGTSASSEGDFLKWNPGEPNNAGQENCVHSNYGGQADWNDIECDSRFQSVCAM